MFPTKTVMGNGNAQDRLLRGKAQFGKKSGLCKNHEIVYKGLHNAAPTDRKHITNFDKQRAKRFSVTGTECPTS